MKNILLSIFIIYSINIFSNVLIKGYTEYYKNEIIYYKFYKPSLTDEIEIKSFQKTFINSSGNFEINIENIISNEIELVLKGCKTRIILFENTIVNCEIIPEKCTVDGCKGVIFKFKYNDKLTEISNKINNHIKTNNEKETINLNSNNHIFNSLCSMLELNIKILKFNSISDLTKINDSIHNTLIKVNQDLSSCYQLIDNYLNYSIRLISQKNKMFPNINDIIKPFENTKYKEYSKNKTFEYIFKYYSNTINPKTISDSMNSFKIENDIYNINYFRSKTDSIYYRSEFIPFKMTDQNGKFIYNSNLIGKISIIVFCDLNKLKETNLTLKETKKAIKNNPNINFITILTASSQNEMIEYILENNWNWTFLFNSRHSSFFKRIGINPYKRPYIIIDTDVNIINYYKSFKFNEIIDNANELYLLN